MNKIKELDLSEAVEAYDDEAEASNWLGPEVAFGLSFKYMNAGERILDIGIGTGLGSILFHKAGLQVTGMDISDDMLETCRKKQITSNLTKHNLLCEPYPYESESIDHAVCVGVMNFFKDLSLIFREVSRILCEEGVFVFIVADQSIGDEPEITVGPEHTHTGSSITMYRHSQKQIFTLLDQNGFELKRSLKFPIQMDRKISRVFKAKAYVVSKKSRI